MIIEIREDDCYPCKNPIAKVFENNSSWSREYNVNTSIEDIEKALELCRDITDILNNMYEEKINA